MKFNITEWIINGDISPLKWGDTSKEIEELFHNSNKEINDLRQRNYPYIILDFVEFYFEDDYCFTGLSEIIINVYQLYKGIRTIYFEPDWITPNLTFKEVTEKLNHLQVNFKIEYGPHFNTPNIETITGVFFGFDSERLNDEDASLLKIIIQK